MYTTTTTAPGHYDHPPHLDTVDTYPVRRVGLIDRFALHAGIALIRWGRRPRVAESRERRAHRYEQHVARLARENATQRSLALQLPRR